ncbi:hypothetical protein SprV_0802619100 [Sparganum proliferum]
MFALSDEASYKASDGLEDNVVTSRDRCIRVSVKLPEKLTYMAVDDLSLPCDGKHCKALGDNYLNLAYDQEKVGSHYLVTTNICEPELYSFLGYEMEKFRENPRTTRITQYLAPVGQWPKTQIGSIVPQLSMPLIRNVTEGTTVTVQCAISKKRSYNLEDVVIFDLNRVFCENDETVHTCERREHDKDTIIFSATVSNSEANPYYPEQYVFCNAMGSYLSIKLIWIKDTSTETTEQSATEQTPSLGPITSGQPHIRPSDGLEDNVVTSTGDCIWAVSYLPEPLTNIAVDELRYHCYGGLCRAPGDSYYKVEYTQERVGNKHLVKAKICEPEKFFMIDYEVEKLRTHRRKTRITQYLVPNGNWSVKQKGCISPQHTIPFIRNLTEGSETIVQCALSKKRSYNFEEVVIFDLNTVFCEYNDNVRTCERRELDEDTVVFSTTVFRTEPNEYYPDQYVFCNAMESYMSLKITWDGAYPGDTCICED